ncbi:MAG: sigma-70 family RNA polymerase sigma factor [Chloroflexi bacterium]|nr:sigma-70 family RNA polymerase sigma factor [Chloroflexota bacterium]
MNEAELIRRSQAGDEGAFCMLVEHHRQVLFGTAYLMTQDRALAEDAVQEALIKMWRHLPSLRLQENFKAWLVRIVSNEVRQQYRKKRVPTVSLEEADGIGGDPDEAEATALRNEERIIVSNALEVLPDEQYEAVMLRYYADLTVPEIARAMRCREGTVKSRLSRALDRLAAVLRDGQRPRGLGQEP